MEQGISGEKLVGTYTEIMPGRPTIAEHRHPFDDVRRPITPDASLSTKLHTMIITAAEQQTMNFYMNLGTFYPTSDLGRKLFLEIGMIEEQHVTQYESLMDPTSTWLECLLMHEYCECYLYYSAMSEESNEIAKRFGRRTSSKSCRTCTLPPNFLKSTKARSGRRLFPTQNFPRFSLSAITAKRISTISAIF